MSPSEAARRTCIACRSEEDRDDLVRLVRAPDGQIAVDLRGTLPGRGAWVHPIAGCVERIRREPGLAHRAFHEPTDPGPLLDTVRTVVRAALADGLSIAAGGGGLVYGHDAVEAAAKAGAVTVVATASDASPRTIASATGARSGEHTIPVVGLPFDRDTLGRRVGQGPIAVLGVRDVSCTVHLRRQLRRWARLG